MEYAILAFVFVLLGIGIYWVDLLVIGWLKKQKGLIVGRSWKPKVIVAALIVILIQILFDLEGDHGGLHSILIYSFIEFVGLVISFFWVARPFIKKMPGKISKGIKYVDDLEAGRRNIVDDLNNTDTVRKVEAVKVLVSTPKPNTVKAEPLEERKVIPPEEKTVDEKKVDTGRNLRESLKKYKGS